MKRRNSGQSAPDPQAVADFFEGRKLSVARAGARLTKKQLNGLAIGMETIDRLLTNPENTQALADSFDQLYRENPVKALFVAATLAEKLQRSGVLARYFDVAENQNEKGDKTYTFVFADKAQINQAGDHAQDRIELRAEAGSTFPAED